LKTLLFLLLFSPFVSFAQSVSEKENQFVKLVAIGENAPAHALLTDLLLEDSTGIYRLADAAEKLILPGSGQSFTPSNLEIHQLFQLYDFGSRHDPAGSSDWRIRQALLGIRYPAAFPGQQGDLLEIAVTTAPYECPLMLYERWAEWEIKAWTSENKHSKAKNLSASSNIAAAWQKISDLLYCRMIRKSDETESTGRLLQHLSLQMRNLLPDCADLEKANPRPSDEKSTIAFLVLSDLQQCAADETVWNNALTRATARFPEAWMYRAAANRKYADHDFVSARQYWEQAESLETDPVRKASDLLRIADIFALVGENNSSRIQIKRAMQLHPSWGEPYFQLCDLYLESVANCNFSAFDQKAIYWLAIDLCQQAKNVDSGCETEATNRIYRYKQLTPTAAETAFKGLKSGDTWPLRCWMSTVTTVK
jgi:hypothetical protein